MAKQLQDLNSDYLKEIIAHELGHVCISILRNSAIGNIFITKVVITNTNCNKGPICGWVEYAPKDLLDSYDKVIQNNSLASYCFLSLAAGCIFQELIPENSSLIFKDCFKCTDKDAIGYGDAFNYYELESKFRHKENYKSSKYFVENLIQFSQKDLFKIISNSRGFIDKLNELTNQVSDNIIEYIITNKLSKYTYEIEGENLNSLISKLELSLKENNLNTQIVELADNIISHLEAHTEK